MSRREHLEWLRDLLRESIIDTEPDKRAPLANQYRRVLAELDALDEPIVQAGGNVSPIELARQRRKDRRA